MEKGSITLKDIARIAGVSPATVSLALAGDPRVNIKTRQAVEEVAKRLKYVPNEIGRSLRVKRSDTIALIFPNTAHNTFSHPYFVKLLEGISEVLNQNNMQLLLSTSPWEEVAAYEAILKNRRADGIILWPASIKDRNIVRIIESGFPVVYLGRWHHDGVLTVERDEVGGARRATEHLLQLGRRRIVHISGPLDYQVSLDRLEGYKLALQDFKLLYDSDLVLEEDFTVESGRRAVSDLLSSGVSFDAIFAGNDRMAIGAMQELQRHGIQIPEDVAVIGYDNMEMSAFTQPALTTVEQPIRQIGILAAQKLISLLNGQPVTECNTIVSSSIIIRESCGSSG